MIIVEDRERKNEIAASFLDNILCRIGIHRGEWIWIRTNCQQRRSCLFCGASQNREKHGWSRPYYVSKSSPELSCRCHECGKTLLVDSLFSQAKFAILSLIEKSLCYLDIHQGEWTTEGCSGCWQRRFCIFCGKLQNREVHNWPPNAVGEYFKDGSCEMRVTCLHCEKTKSIGKYHEGRISWWNSNCKRCGEDLSGD